MVNQLQNSNAEIQRLVEVGKKMSYQTIGNITGGYFKPLSDQNERESLGLDKMYQTYKFTKWAFGIDVLKGDHLIIDGISYGVELVQAHNGPVKVTRIYLTNNDTN